MSVLFPYGTVSIETKTTTLHQADCERCGWHTRQAEGDDGRRWVTAMARSHYAICPNPLIRSGGLMDCGCWWYASPGSCAGQTKARCPLHGLTVMVKANVDEHTRYGTGHWTPAAETGGDAQ